MMMIKAIMTPTVRVLWHVTDYYVKIISSSPASLALRYVYKYGIGDRIVNGEVF